MAENAENLAALTARMHGMAISCQRGKGDRRAVQVPGVGGAGSGGRRRRFRGWAVQVPIQGRNLHRESAFYAALVVQVPALKWNLRHLRLNLRRLSLNLRHRGASVHFRNSPADVRTKKRQSRAVPMYVHPHLQPVEGTSSDVRTKKQHSSAVSMYVHPHLQPVEGTSSSAPKANRPSLTFMSMASAPI